MSTQNELFALLIGLESFQARIEILKLNYFEKLKTLDKKSLLYKISNFRYECIFSPLLDNFCHPDCTLASSVYEFHNLYHKFHMFKDFNFNISTLSSKRKTFLKKRVLEFHFNNDLKILPTKKSTQLFRSCCKDMKDNPYRGTLICYVLSANFKREHRTIIFKCLAGQLLENPKSCRILRTFRGVCKFCRSPDPCLEHFIFECTHLKPQQQKLRKSSVNFLKPSSLNKSDITRDISVFLGNPCHVKGTTHAEQLTSINKILTNFATFLGGILDKADDTEWSGRKHDWEPWLAVIPKHTCQVEASKKPRLQLRHSIPFMKNMELAARQEGELGGSRGALSPGRASAAGGTRGGSISWCVAFSQLHNLWCQNVQCTYHFLFWK